MKFEKYPFERLKELTADIVPNTKYEYIALTIGEPKFDTPEFILDRLCKESTKLRSYPKIAGEKELKDAMLGFMKRRFSLDILENELIPTLGTREVLFNFPQFLLFDKKNPVMAYTNPFYQIYEGAAIASKAKIYTLDLNIQNDFKPEQNSEVLSQCDLVILNFPNNPTGSVLSLDELVEWVELAQKYDFVLLNDECYSEIYINNPPPSILQASKKAGIDDFNNILCVNSISKRSSAPGLRSGFISGDKKILKEYMKYRTFVGATNGVPMQLAAALAWSDDEHVEAFRQKYKTNAKLASQILNIPEIEATFYIWLKVEDDEKMAYKLLEKYNIGVLPGSYLGRDGAGKGYIRIALVESKAKSKEALTRLKKYIDEEL